MNENEARGLTEMYIALTSMEGIGIVTQNRLLTVCGGIRNCFSMDKAEILKHTRNIFPNLRLKLRGLLIGLVRVGIYVEQEIAMNAIHKHASIYLIPVSR